MGDRAAGAMLAGTIGTALFARAATGRGAHVTTSLAATGAWLLGSDMSDALRGGDLVRKADRRQMRFPTMNCYRTADGRWLWLQLMHPEVGWKELLAAIGAPWLDEDTRFRGGRNLADHSTALIEILDRIFAEATLADWTARLSARDVRYAVVQTIEEAARDDLMRASGAFVETPERDGRPVLDVAAPCTFRSSVTASETPAPTLGQDTVKILGEFDLSAEEIATLRAAGVVA
jgi:formyl-CoA transferase